MVNKSLIVATCACLAVVSFNADASLESRLGGQAYFDTAAGLTWLADANYAQTSNYDADGLMDWTAANTWAASLTLGSVTWRLPGSDTTCNGTGTGYDCTGSEMGTLFYTALGNSAGTFTNTGPFSNVQSVYWSGTAYDASNAYVFQMDAGGAAGLQATDTKANFNYAWAVYDGDVGTVPVPAAVWLFGSGLMGLFGLARRKSANI